MNTAINMSFDLEKDLQSAVDVGIRTAVYREIVSGGRRMGNHITVVDRTCVAHKARNN